MPFFNVRANLSVEVEISISAEDAESAEAIFLNSIALYAELSDVSANYFSVVEDSISSIDHIETKER